MATERAVKLDLGFVPEAAVSGPILFQTDLTTVLTFNAVAAAEDGKRYRAGTAWVEFRQTLLTRFGLPNDEAMPAHPLSRWGVHAYGCYEILDSTWVEQVELENGRPLVSPMFFDGPARHFVCTFHDSSFQCIAADLESSLIAGSDDIRPAFDALFDRIMHE